MRKDPNPTGQRDDASSQNPGEADRQRRSLRVVPFDYHDGSSRAGRQGGGLRLWTASSTERRAQRRDDLVFLLGEIAPQLRKKPGKAAAEVAAYLDILRLGILDELEGE